MSPQHPHPIRGVLLVMAAVFLFSSMDTLAKSMLRSYPLPPLIWARYTVHFVFMLVLLAPRMGFDPCAHAATWSAGAARPGAGGQHRLLLPCAHLSAARRGGRDHLRRAGAGDIAVGSAAGRTRHAPAMDRGVDRVPGGAGDHPTRRRTIELCGGLSSAQRFRVFPVPDPHAQARGPRESVHQPVLHRAGRHAGDDRSAAVFMADANPASARSDDRDRLSGRAGPLSC